ncbi:MAG: protein-export chaperone SecB [Gallionella sp.]|nr:protein-export chaperone SecB [Gallionella sp.]
MDEVTQAAKQAVFNIDKIYLKDISLEIPHAPGIFLERDASQFEVQLNTLANSIKEGVFEVTVMATVTCKMGEKVAYLIEVKHAGIFQAHNIPQEEIEPLLAVTCPEIIFPYLREAVSEMTVRGGFPPLLLNPVNFLASYQNSKAQQAAPVTTH